LVSAWLLIEQPGAWGPDALTESGFPPEIGRELERRSRGVRILLIRRRTESENGLTYFKAHSGAGGSEPSLVSASLTEPETLLGIDFASLARGEVGEGTTVDRPIYLVCTHGRHDICCADNGRPLYRAMSEMLPDRSWEVSHLGGDRFAGNLLVLPRGDYFGRVGATEAESLVAGYEAGRLSLSHHRGRSIQPRSVQAAEHFVRESEGLRGLDDLSLAEYRRFTDDRAEVLFVSPGGFIRVQIGPRVVPEASYLTCRADQQGHPVEYEIFSMARE